MEEQEVIEFNNKDRKYKWLGTFNLGKKFKFQGREYVTIEHAINAQKNQDPDFQDLFTKGADSYIGDIASSQEDRKQNQYEKNEKENDSKLGKGIFEVYERNSYRILSSKPRS